MDRFSYELDAYATELLKKLQDAQKHQLLAQVKEHLFLLLSLTQTGAIRLFWGSDKKQLLKFSQDIDKSIPGYGTFAEADLREIIQGAFERGIASINDIPLAQWEIV